MRKVDVIMTASLETIQGPVQTIKRIRNNKDFYYANGYDLSFYTLDNLSETVIQKIRANDSLLIRRLKEFARFLALHSWIYAWYRVRHLFTSSHRILKYYQSLNRKPDIIVFHSIMDCYMYLKYYKIEGVKVSLFTHSDGLIFKMLLLYYPRLIGGRVDRKLKSIANYVMSNVDVKPCIARIEEINLLNNFQQLQGKTCLVINAIDDLTDDQKRISETIKRTTSGAKYRLACSGSINGRKGQWMIIEALAKLPEAILKDFHLTLIGDGPERITLEDKVAKYNIADSVTFTGALSNDDVYKKLSESNIYVLMSQNEGLPISLIEAMRNGMALISTNVSGIPELINEGENGKLLNPKTEELYELFMHFNEYDWMTMGIKSRDIFEKQYVFTRMRQDYLNMLNKAFED